MKRSEVRDWLDGMVMLSGLLPDRSPPGLEKQFRLAVPALQPIERRKGTPHHRRVRMLASQCFLVDRQRTLETWLCLAVPALRVIQAPKLAHRRRRVRMLATHRFPFDRQRAPEKRLSLAVPALRLIQARKLMQRRRHSLSRKAWLSSATTRPADFSAWSMASMKS